MTAAYRMRGLGWFLAVVVVVLGFYLVSLQVAAERKKLDDVDRQIALTVRNLRGLDTEFNARSNLAQLERWNGDVLGLAAPNADQFVPDEQRLAMIDFRPGATAQPDVRQANYVVPSLPVDADRQAPVQTAAATPQPAPQVAAAREAAPAPAAKAAPVARAQLAAVVAPVIQKARPRVIAAAATTPVTPRPAARPHSVAMLDRKRMADATLSDLLSRADIGTERSR